MKIIKFKAWNIHKKMFIDFDDLDISKSLGMGKTKNSFQLHVKYLMGLPEECILMQFTGLLDKNGKEIYENDIIEVFGIRNDSEGLWEVYWATDRWHLKRGEESYDNGDYYHGYDIRWDPFYSKEHPGGEKGGVIVRGNRYENPELVKG